MGRKPIGKRAMTPAERQARRRAKLRKEASKAVSAGKRRAARDKANARYIPYPPGITYYEAVTVTLQDGGKREIWTPKTRPLAACHTDIADDDVLALLEQLNAIAKERGLLAP